MALNREVDNPDCTAARGYYGLSSQDNRLRSRSRGVNRGGGWTFQLSSNLVHNTLLGFIGVAPVALVLNGAENSPAEYQKDRTEV